jgi:hypothetical protein
VLGGGRDNGHSGGAKSTPAPAVCDFDMSIRPLSGWGDDGADARQQRSTAGWLASFAVFEPHWQVTLADARASGTVNWNGTLYEFVDAPFYAEKVRRYTSARPSTERLSLVPRRFMIIPFFLCLCILFHLISFLSSPKQMSVRTGVAPSPASGTGYNATPLMGMIV